jgi:hypothetical protein
MWTTTRGDGLVRRALKLLVIGLAVAFSASAQVPITSFGRAADADDPSMSQFSSVAPKACPGCCSSHGGISNSCGTGGRIRCNDGTTSPTCSCSSCGVPSSPVPPNYTLQVVVQGTGSVQSTPTGISCPNDCSGTYASGSSVSLRPTAPSGWRFDGWSGACTGMASCTVLLFQNRSVVATFSQPPPTQFDLSVSVQGQGAVSSSPQGITCPSDCMQAYSEGTQVTLSATPVIGWRLVGWTGACSGFGSCSVNMSQTRAVNATFSMQSTPANPTLEGRYVATVVSGVSGTVGSNDPAFIVEFVPLLNLQQQAAGRQAYYFRSFHESRGPLQQNLSDPAAGGTEIRYNVLFWDSIARTGTVVTYDYDTRLTAFVRESSVGFRGALSPTSGGYRMFGTSSLRASSASRFDVEIVLIGPTPLPP